MKDVYEIKRLVDTYCDRHGITPKYTKCYPNEMYYSVLAMDATQIEAKAVNTKNGNRRIQFKVDGKVTSIKK